jgi:hypothetical protein
MMNMKVLVRLPSRLHRHLKWEAKAEGMSLNSWIIYRLAASDRKGAQAISAIKDLRDIAADFNGRIPEDHARRIFHRVGFSDIG